MNNTQVLQRITGISGVMIGVIISLVIPLYFMYPGAPPAWNVFHALC